MEMLKQTPNGEGLFVLLTGHESLSTDIESWVDLEALLLHLSIFLAIWLPTAIVGGRGGWVASSPRMSWSIFSLTEWFEFGRWPMKPIPGIDSCST